MWKALYTNRRTHNVTNLVHTPKWSKWTKREHDTMLTGTHRLKRNTNTKYINEDYRTYAQRTVQCRQHICEMGIWRQRSLHPIPHLQSPSMLPFTNHSEYTEHGHGMHATLSKRNRIKFANGEHRTTLVGSKCCNWRTDTQTVTFEMYINLCNQQIWIPFRTRWNGFEQNFESEHRTQFGWIVDKI